MKVQWWLFWEDMRLLASNVDWSVIKTNRWELLFPTLFAHTHKQNSFSHYLQINPCEGILNWKGKVWFPQKFCKKLLITPILCECSDSLELSTNNFTAKNIYASISLYFFWIYYNHYQSQWMFKIISSMLILRHTY